jgi:hypothetical protein
MSQGCESKRYPYSFPFGDLRVVRGGGHLDAPGLIQHLVMPWQLDGIL